MMDPAANKYEVSKTKTVRHTFAVQEGPTYYQPLASDPRPGDDPTPS